MDLIPKMNYSDYFRSRKRNTISTKTNGKNFRDKENFRFLKENLSCIHKLIQLIIDNMECASYSGRLRNG